MSAAATAAGALAMTSRKFAVGRERERIRDAAAVKELQYRSSLISHVALWGNFPVTMRPFWLAQRSRCPYCGEQIDLERGARHRSSWDHVVPSSAGGRGHADKNKVLAHQPCNQRKGDRMPTACEVLFCQVTNEIVAAMREVKA